jgi:hypothetical protein
MSAGTTASVEVVVVAVKTAAVADAAAVDTVAAAVANLQNLEMRYEGLIFDMDGTRR